MWTRRQAGKSRQGRSCDEYTRARVFVAGESLSRARAHARRRRVVFDVPRARGFGFRESCRNVALMDFSPSSYEQPRRRVPSTTSQHASCRRRPSSVVVGIETAEESSDETPATGRAKPHPTNTAASTSRLRLSPFCLSAANDTDERKQTARARMRARTSTRARVDRVNLKFATSGFRRFYREVICMYKYTTCTRFPDIYAGRIFAGFFYLCRITFTSIPFGSTDRIYGDNIRMVRILHLYILAT